MEHITKFKGDIAMTQIIADLTKNNIDCCLPISEHLPFDLIAHKDNKCFKIQVKYSSLRGGAYFLSLRSNKYNNTKGGYSVPIDLSKIDIFAIYCAEVNKICYLTQKSIQNRHNGMRIHPTKLELYDLNRAFI